MRLVWLAAALALIGAGAAASANDPAAEGEAIFKDRCNICHYDAEQAPPLAGVVGRPVAGAQGFFYSDALKQKGGVWDEAKLDSFLADSQAYVPGGFMTVKEPDPKVRAALIAYLKTLR